MRQADQADREDDMTMEAKLALQIKVIARWP
jgi:hypothetical protein